MRKQLSLNGLSTYDDLGMYVADAPIIGPAKPRTKYIVVDGADGSLDFSSALTGEILFDRRDVSFSLLYVGDNPDMKRAEIENLFSGQLINIVLPDDPEHYLTGRASAEASHEKGRSLQIDFRAACDPWRYKDGMTAVTVSMTGSAIPIILPNEQRRVSPSWTVTGGQVSVIFGGTTYVLGTGTQTRPGILLAAGGNPVTLSGAAGSAVTITYQEASL
ncbi:MAG: hypothetical protein LBS85_02875 [Clostridiales Family XIII bacterium]|jgi:hypothetical protein|nr:hypothetical protein [Clostridiales Family XIII bacterium]